MGIKLEQKLKKCKIEKIQNKNTNSFTCHHQKYITISNNADNTD